jgi:hypothetical protein
MADVVDSAVRSAAGRACREGVSPHHPHGETPQGHGRGEPPQGYRAAGGGNTSRRVIPVFAALEPPTLPVARRRR